MIMCTSSYAAATITEPPNYISSETATGHSCTSWQPPKHASNQAASTSATSTAPRRSAGGEGPTPPPKDIVATSPALVLIASTGGTQAGVRAHMAAANR